MGERLPIDGLPEGWGVASWARADGTEFVRKFGPIRAIASLAHKGRPRGAWRAGVILHDKPDGPSASMPGEDASTRDEAMRKAEKLATALTIWIVGRARELAGFGDDAPTGGR